MIIIITLSQDYTLTITQSLVAQWLCTIDVTKQSTVLAKYTVNGHVYDSAMMLFRHH